jgi:hypothetical protein
MSTATARILLDTQIRDVVSAGIKRGAIPLAIRETIDLADISGGAKLKVWGATYENIAPSTTTVLLLTNSLLDADGNAITWGTINAIIVQNRRTTASAWVQVGPDTTAGFGAPGFWPSGATTGNEVGPESFVCLYDKTGVTVTAATADEIALITSGVADSTNVFDVILVGRE